MLLRDDDPRASILLAWLVTRNLLAPVAPDMREVGAVRLPADAEPWVARWDGITADLAAPPADTFLEAFHGAPLEELLARQCGHARPSLGALDEEAFERLARAIDRAYRNAPAAPRRTRDPSALVEAASAELGALGFVWSADESAFVQHTDELVLRVALALERRRPPDPGLEVRMRASARSPRVDRLGDVLKRRDPPDLARILSSPLLERAQVKTVHPAQHAADLARMVGELAELGRWIRRFQRASTVLGALSVDLGWASANADAAWPDRRAVLAVVHGLETPAEAIEKTVGLYRRFARTEAWLARTRRVLETILEIAQRPDEPPAAAAPARRVRHAKFGAGTVMAERDGKLVVAFDDGAERTLLPRSCPPE